MNIIYPQDLLWIAPVQGRIDLQDTRVVILQKPDVQCRLVPGNASIIGEFSCVHDFLTCDYVEVTMMQDVSFIPFGQKFYPYYRELLTQLPSSVYAQGFQFVDVPVLGMSIKEIQRYSSRGKKVPFQVRLWV